MEPISEKMDKKSVFSVYCGNKITMSYDRDNPFKKAAHRTIEFPNQFLQTYRRIRPIPAAGSHLQNPQSLAFS